jgi:hypothetical protein
MMQNVLRIGLGRATIAVTDRPKRLAALERGLAIPSQRTISKALEDYQVPFPTRGRALVRKSATPRNFLEIFHDYILAIETLQA